MKTRTLSCALTLATLIAVGCAPKSPPPELVNARNEFARVQSGPASQVNPAGVYEARRSLETAEKSFDQDGDSDESRSLAYVAQRKALMAEANAGAVIAANQQAQAEMAIDQLEKSQLGEAKEQLMEERRAREAADRRAKEAFERLGIYASIKEDARGRVVTITGSLLFAYDKSDLLPSAKTRLDAVAEALQTVKGRDIIVVGYTDSRGSDAYNVGLSERRAESVKRALVERGVSAAAIRTEGRGETDPVASNDTAEGRANNRRVEIVIENPKEGMMEGGKGGMSGAKKGTATPPKTTTPPKAPPPKAPPKKTMP